MMKTKCLILFMAFFVLACESQQPEIPYRKVRFNVSIPSTQLNYVGGYEYFTGGVSGIVVYRSDMNSYLAYDRACPHDWQDGGRVEVINSIFLYDSLCGSMFNILDGSPIGGPATGFLRPYSTYVEDEFTLRVYN